MPGALFQTSGQVELRTIEPEDADFLRRVVNDPQVRRSLAAVEPVNGPQEEEWIESIGESGDTKLLVCVDGDAVGSVTLREPNEVWGVAEIGYMVDPAAWNNGYATDAVEGICRLAFEERRLNKVYATVYAGNDGSRRVLEKVGFTEEGLLRQEGFVDGEHVDVCRYGLLAEEFE
jgi:RimJ/RimL family protein N-acetyltransferase